MYSASCRGTMVHKGCVGVPDEAVGSLGRRCGVGLSPEGRSQQELMRNTDF